MVSKMLACLTARRSTPTEETAMSPPLPKWQPKRTLIDLYNEKDSTSWYWRAAATFSAFLIMLGYVVLDILSLHRNSRPTALLFSRQPLYQVPQQQAQLAPLESPPSYFWPLAMCLRLSLQSSVRAGYFDSTFFSFHALHPLCWVSSIFSTLSPPMTIPCNGHIPRLLASASPRSPR